MTAIICVSIVSFAGLLAVSMLCDTFKARTYRDLERRIQRNADGITALQNAEKGQRITFTAPDDKIPVENVNAPESPKNGTVKGIYVDRDGNAHSIIR